MNGQQQAVMYTCIALQDGAGSCAHECLSKILPAHLYKPIKVEVLQ